MLKSNKYIFIFSKYFISVIESVIDSVIETNIY